MIKRIQLYCTNKCQLNCEFCPKSVMDIPDVYMNMDTFKKYVNICIEYGIHEFELSPLVGESLCDPDIFERIEYLNNIPQVTKIFFFTNMLLLSEEWRISKLMKYNKFRLHLSIYGDNKETFSMRTNSNAFEDTIIALGNIIRMQPIIDEIVLRYIPSIPDSRFKLLLYTLAHIYPHLNLIENSFDVNWNTELINITDTLNDPPIRRNDIKPQLCEYVLLDNGIWPDGNVGICSCWFDINKRMILGNINKQLLNEIFGDKFNQIITEQKEGLYRSLCAKCSWLNEKERGEIECL